MDKNRKILLLIGLGVMVVGVAILIYIFFFKSLSPTLTPADQGGVITPGGLPGVGPAGERLPGQAAGRLEGIIQPGPSGPITPTPIAEGGFTQISAVTNQNIFEPHLNNSGQLVYYDRDTNYFYRQTPTGPERLSDQAFYGASKITWDNQGNKVVIYYPDGNKIIYDFAKQKQYAVPKEFSELQFSSDGERLAAKQIVDNTSQNWLVVFSPDGRLMKGVEQLGDNGNRVTINWSPSDQVVAFLKEGRGGNSEEIFPVGQNKENFAAFKISGYGFDALWAPNNENTFLFSTSRAEDGFRPSLYLGRGSADNLGSSQLSLDLQTTPDKCAFNAAGTAAYCAVPQNLPAVAGPFPQLAQGLQNDFYKIDLETGKINLLGQPYFTIEGQMENVDVERVFVSPNENILYFTNRATGQVYQMRLR